MWTRTGYLGARFETLGMWGNGLVNLVFTLTTMCCIVDMVSSQCSEAHRQTCFSSYLQLRELNEPFSPTYRYIPDYNVTTLRTVCRYYIEYRNCSQPFLSSCDVNTVIELQTYDATLGYICSDQRIFNDYLSHKNCFNRLQYSHSTCKQKGLASLEELDVTSSAYKYTMCRSARDYVLCIYTATALGCSMQAAEVYFNLLNHSIGNMFSFQHYDCSIQHPMDVISIYTTTPPTVSTSLSTTTEGDHIRGDNQEHYKETSGSSQSRINHLTNMFGCVLFICFCEYVLL